MNAKQPVRSSGGIPGLPPRYCSDPTIFDLEQKHLFPNQWFPIGYESDIAGNGEHFSFQLLGLDGFCVRDDHDQLHCFRNVCRHRGTQLCPVNSSGLGTVPEGEPCSGNPTKSSIVCDYHGWKYGLDGRLIAAPHMDNTPGFNRADFSLYPIRCATWQGIIFAQVGPGQDNPTDSLTEILHPLNRIVEPRGLDQFQRKKTISYVIQANWKLLFQNFNECYHCPSVHPQLTPLTDYRDAENEFDTGPILGGPMRIRDDADSVTRDGDYCGPVPDSLVGEELKKAHYYTVSPGFFLSLFPDYVMVHRLSPLAFNQTKIDCDFLFLPASGLSLPTGATAWEFWDQTNLQDWEMCERVQRGISQGNFLPSPYSPLESLLVKFDQHYRQQIARFE